MRYQKLLFSKNGQSAMLLAQLFIGIPVGEKIPTVSELSESIDLARGTIQGAIKLLQEQKAISLEARGHLGSFLISKDMMILLEFSGVHSIVGVMPLPYSKRYEGFATGIISELENQYNIPVSMAYMRGAQNRISMLLSNRYDFAIISKYAANILLSKDVNIKIIKEFNEYSYLSRHIIVFHDQHVKEITNGMKIGIDKDSIDQTRLTQWVCEGKEVQFVPLEYNQILNKTLHGEVDAAVWNEDEIKDKLIQINYVPVSVMNSSDTEAVLVVDGSKKEMAALLDEIIDVETVLQIQKHVLEGKLTPSY